MDAVNQIRAKFEMLAPVMDERMMRLWAAAEAMAFGRGGYAAVFEATGIRAKRILSGVRDLRELKELPPSEPARLQRIRRPGAGRKRLEDQNPELLGALDALIDPVTRGDPQSPLRWTTKSTRKLASELTEEGHRISATKVRELLDALGYSLQGTAKTREGAQHPERNAQFEYIARRTKELHRRGQPVISVDTKKKELVGDFKVGGQEWQPKGEPVAVRVHDFLDKELGKAIPYGVYDLLRNEGWVNVGVDHDTAEFAVASIRRWWERMGRVAYPDAKELLITADAGGSNGPKVRLWKMELQQFADETGLQLHVSHFPPGTSKWNKIEHRMFSHITQNWRGRPLESVETVVNLIASTTTTTGLRVRASLDRRKYAPRIKISNAQLTNIRLSTARARPAWNYSIGPNG